ncbi:hypothetical protein EYF80_013098 [Liparis tanakae]|uniref:Uncharacterized protein n=1 Tax=Liparis tanakae TaxID=230148 RepID=A0A4Z2IFB1_9TELE|nr:hypothetical protein EYF80_013098 [Liparis tanakae]
MHSVVPVQTEEKTGSAMWSDWLPASVTTVLRNRTDLAKLKLTTRRVINSRIPKMPLCWLPELRAERGFLSDDPYLWSHGLQEGERERERVPRQLSRLRDHWTPTERISRSKENAIDQTLGTPVGSGK